MTKYSIKKICKYNGEIIPIIFCGNANGLGIARSFLLKKIPCIIVDTYKSIATYSKNCDYYLVDNGNNEEKILNDIDNLGLLLKKFKKKGLVFCCSDYFLYIIGQNQEKIADKFLLLMPKWENIENCIDKSYVYKKAHELGIPIPKTMIIDGIEKIYDILNEFRLPIIIKPTVTVGFSDIYKKAIEINNEDEILNLIKDLKNLNIDKRKLIIQEMIPGDATNLYTFTSLSNKECKCSAFSIGYKIRQFPHNTGTITSGRVKYIREIDNLGTKLIEGIKYFGIANTEFKYDCRDSKYKLIEINPRPGLWNFSSTATGINMPYMALEMFSNNKSNKKIFTEKEIIWVYDFMDLLKAVFISKKDGDYKYKIGYLEWKRTLKGKKTYAVYSKSDLNPIIHFVLEYFKKIIRGDRK